MIWHMYDNNDKVIVTDSPNQMQYKYNSSPSTISMDTITDEEESSEENTIKKAYASPDSKSLFLKFASDSKSRKGPTALNNKELSKKKASIKVNGVNILNRKNLDSQTIAERIQKRRETHNNLERRRRDEINNTIYELANVLPALPEGQKLNKHNVLKSALNYILFLQSENAQIKQAFEARVSVQNSPHGSKRSEMDTTQIRQFDSLL